MWLNLPATPELPVAVNVHGFDPRSQSVPSGREEEGESERMSARLCPCQTLWGATLCQVLCSSPIPSKDISAVNGVQIRSYRR